MILSNPEVLELRDLPMQGQDKSNTSHLII